MACHADATPFSRLLHSAIYDAVVYAHVPRRVTICLFVTSGYYGSVYARYVRVMRREVAMVMCLIDDAYAT